MLMPPTDSLYKFKAISGIWMITMPFIVFFYADSSLTAKFKQLTLQIEEISALSQKVEKKLTWLESPLNKDLSNEKLINELVDLRDVQKKNLAIAQLDTNAAVRETALVQAAMLVSLILVIVGFFFVKDGFNLWRDKIQVPQDRLLDIELRRAELALKQAENLEKVAIDLSSQQAIAPD